MIKLATVFSGIGAIEQALKKLKIKYEIKFACDNGEIELKDSFETINNKLKKLDDDEKRRAIKQMYVDTKKHNYVKDAYFANYDIDESKWYEDIRFIDGKKFKNKVDLFVGGSPCQSFSIMGKRGGLGDTRGTLFYDYARLIKEIQPKVFIFENVPGMIVHDNGKTWKVIQEVFDSLNYKIYSSILNAKDYGIPQERRRLFVVGFNNKKVKNINFEFPKPIPLKTKMFDYLEDSVDTKHYLGKKGFEFCTNPKYSGRVRLNCDIIQTQKANQQFNWIGDLIFEPLNPKKHNKEILERAYVGTWKGQKGVCRQMTYRECMRLMGFPDNYKIVVPNVPAYRQAGNSIVVNVLEAIIKQINKVVDLDE